MCEGVEPVKPDECHPSKLRHESFRKDHFCVISLTAHGMQAHVCDIWGLKVTSRQGNVALLAFPQRLDRSQPECATFMYDIKA
jgi:hypothetical protein